MTEREQLTQEKLELNEEIARIKHQIEMAKAKALNGDYSDPVWYRKAQHALRMKGQQSQRIQARLSQIKQEEQQSRAESWAQAFVDAAKRRLTPETLQSLKDEADDAVAQATAMAELKRRLSK